MERTAAARGGGAEVKTVQYGDVVVTQFTDGTSSGLESGLAQLADYGCCVYEFALFTRADGTLVWTWKRLCGDCVSHL